MMKSSVARKIKSLVKTRIVGPLSSALRPGNIAMFHIGRSGSRVIGDLLGQHRGIFWDGEVYERQFREWEKRGLGETIRSIPSDPIGLLQDHMTWAGTRYYGFEIKFFHLKLLNVKLEDYIQKLDTLGFKHFIILERKNYLRKIVSSVIAHKNSRFHQGPKEKAGLEKTPIDISNVEIDRDAKPLMSFLDDYRDNFLRLERILSGRDVVRLTYEVDVIQDPIVSYQKICSFLRVTPEEVSVRYGRTNPFKLSELITNFGEVEKALIGSSFEWMLRD